MRGVRTVEKTIEGVETSDGAGVNLKRIIGSPELDYLDPFLLLDEFGSDNPDDYIAGFPPHPHRGFETVTYMLQGRFRHKDSAGNEGQLTSGSIQWMTAGRGVIHSEMPEQVEGMVRGFQLWVNLPKKLKMTEPAYQDIPSEKIPQVNQDGVTVRVITGNHSGVSGPASAKTGMLYLDVHLEESAVFEQTIVDDWNSFLYIYGGSLLVADQIEITRGHLAVLATEGDIRLTGGPTGGRSLLVAGEPLNEPIARGGPFVMNTRGEVLQALEDYQTGKFDKGIF
ncbi:MAG: pirin family protein [Candidatus Neomarinimicrobiota bacterium]|nr:pirin family protein [Candidatus Neomarinimicrobiota bacterium]